MGYKSYDQEKAEKIAPRDLSGILDKIEQDGSEYKIFTWLLAECLRSGTATVAKLRYIPYKGIPYSIPVVTSIADMKRGLGIVSGYMQGLGELSNQDRMNVEAVATSAAEAFPDIVENTIDRWYDTNISPLTLAETSRFTKVFVLFLKDLVKRQRLEGVEKDVLKIIIEELEVAESPSVGTS